MMESLTSIVQYPMNEVHLFVFPHHMFPDNVKDAIPVYSKVIVEGHEKTDNRSGMPQPYLTFLTSLKKKGKNILFMDKNDDYNYPSCKETAEQVSKSKFAEAKLQIALKIVENLEGGEAVVCGELVYESLKILMKHKEIPYTPKLVVPINEKTVERNKKAITLRTELYILDTSYKSH